ncbi:glutamine synthetase family protein [Bartonella sp. DGB1]|uniref:glutamine synthetase family protein n=1 Tax=Bartonella sp. DGB1 TaxID=3239807 RepID=UPI00352530B5
MNNIKDIDKKFNVNSDADKYLNSIKGVENWSQAERWLKEKNIEDIECITPDHAGIARGKMMPAKKFVSETSLALPGAVFMTTISGSYPEDSHSFQYPETDGDLKLVPDLSTLSVVPWEDDPTAQVICDLVDQKGQYVEFTPRNVLRRILTMYDDLGLNPVVAPEIEFYLVDKNTDPDYPLRPPIGRSGRIISGGNGYSIAGVNEFDDLIDDIYHFSEAQGLEIDTLIHEEGVGQFEINLRHGDPLKLADQVFLFKRTIREAAFKHNIYATFMAKPIQGQPGSSMHIHQSITDKITGKNIFSDDDGNESNIFFNYLGGLQKHMSSAIVMLAPYVNSYRRLVPDAAAPVNVHWGYDNRTAAFRVPISNANARRIENRIPASDANSYLAIAASLACGLIGIIDKLIPDAPSKTGVNYEDDISFPRGLLEAVAAFEADKRLREILGEQFVPVYAAIKRAEFETFMEVISPWEREFLLLNV